MFRVLLLLLLLLLSAVVAAFSSRIGGSNVTLYCTNIGILNIVTVLVLRIDDDDDDNGGCFLCSGLER